MSTLPHLAMVAVVTVRDAQLPAGAEETVAEAGGAALLIGSGTEQAALEMHAAARLWTVECRPGTPGRLALALAPVLSAVDTVLLPASPDGRDLAPRLAVTLDRPLLAGAVRCAPHQVELARMDGRLALRVALDGPAVVTLQPGVRGVGPRPPEAAATEITALPLEIPTGAARDAESVELLQPEPSTMDLADAPRILGAGGGLVPPGADGRATMRLLAEVAAVLGASAGATRVVTDAGWTGYDRQIGTTGVAVDPDLYVAFGVSGAVQHLGGLGRPRHVVSVNTDPSCPMTEMAHLGIVADAPAVLDELVKRLGAAPALTAKAPAQPEKEDDHG